MESTPQRAPADESLELLQHVEVGVGMLDLDAMLNRAGEDHDIGSWYCLARAPGAARQLAGSPACDAVSGIDAHELRPDVAPRPVPVSEEEKADAVGAQSGVFLRLVPRLAGTVLLCAGSPISAASVSGCEGDCGGDNRRPDAHPRSRFGGYCAPVQNG